MCVCVRARQSHQDKVRNILSISRHPSCKPADQPCLDLHRVDLRLISAFQEPLAKYTLCIRKTSYMNKTVLQAIANILAV